jgi:hypothetical protein
MNMSNNFNYEKVNSLCSLRKPVGEWRYTSTHFKFRHQIRMSGHIHTMADLDLGKKASGAN